MGRFWSKNENKWFYPNTYQLIAVCYAPKSVFYTYLIPVGSFRALKGPQFLPNLTQNNGKIDDK